MTSCGLFDLMHLLYFDLKCRYIVSQMNKVNLLYAISVVFCDFAAF